MVTVPIVKIPIDDADWQKFRSSYDTYLESLKKLPGEWGKQNAQIAQTGVSFVELAAALFAQSELTHKVKDDHEKIEKSAKKSAGFWKDMKRDTRDVLSNITGATEQLLKWTGLTTIAAGLLGAGGLFGADKLALTTSGFRRQGFVINATIGEQRAFKIDYQKYIASPEDFLSGVNDVGNDLTKQGSVFGQQVGSLTRAGMDSAQIAAKLLPAMVDRFIAMGGLQGRGAQIMQPLGLDQYGSLQDFMSLARQRQALGQSGRDFQRDSQYLGVSQDTADKMQNFVNQLDRAGGKIETVFVNDLAPLEPGLEKLSKAAVDLLDSFLKSDQLKHWLGEVSDGMESLAGWLGKMGLSSPGSGGPASSLPTGGPISSNNHPDYSKGDWYDRNVNALAFPGGAKGDYNPSDALLNGIKAGEGSGPNAVSPKGARGVYQFMPDTAKQYGLTDPTDTVASRAAAKALLRDLLAEFGGDQAKAVAAYNWGPRNLQNDIDKYGADWRSHLPNETKNYLGKVELTVQNQTGGSAVIGANQVAQ
jgi:hypothetical protein